MRYVRFSSRAELDLYDIWRFIAEDSIDAADALMVRFQRVADRLVEQPDSGESRPELREDARSVPIGNYVMIYRTTPDSIEILRVIHGARDVPRLFDE